MSSESMLAKLDQYYQSQGIPAVGFNCKHREACSAVCAPGKMVTAQEPYVGPEYEKGTLPRLLFISSDANDPNWLVGQPECGALRCIREITLRDGLTNTNLKKHWYKTIYLAKALLAPFSKDRLGHVMEMKEIIEYVAHTRSTRCKDGSIGTKEGHPDMFNNCRGFLKGEVETMQPDIIVTQGERARDALVGAFRVIERVDMPGKPHHGAFYETIQIAEGHKAIKIVAWHPCAHWKGYQKGEFMDWAAKSVQERIPFA